MSNELYERAVLEFGKDQAHGLWGELVKRVGPVLAEILLRWILSKSAGTQPPVGASMSVQDVRKWVVALLRSHRNELVSFLKDRVEDVVDLLLDILDSEGSPTPEFAPK